VDSIRRRVLQSYSGKEILIGETGWPSAGRMREGALPSPANQARVIHEVLAAANRGQYRVNVIEAFDQPWKRWLEGTVGGHWGLLDADGRQPKFAWGEPVSNHPHWGVQAGGGGVLAAIVFAAAWFGRRADTQSATGAWLAIAAIAFVAGALIGWTIEKALIESLGAGGWVRSAVLVGLAIVAPITVAVAWMQSAPLPSFSQVLGGEDGRPAAIVLALGLTLAVLCAMALHVALALVFDPRYRDFPFTALTAASLPFLLLVLRCPPRGGLRAAELASAGVLGLSAVYIVLNESFANWQALWFAGALIALVATLLRAAAARSSR
jgi:glucan 1,3-beta-glucosidase